MTDVVCEKKMFPLFSLSSRTHWRKFMFGQATRKAPSGGALGVRPEFSARAWIFLLLYFFVIFFFRFASTFLFIPAAACISFYEDNTQRLKG